MSETDRPGDRTIAPEGAGADPAAPSPAARKPRPRARGSIEPGPQLRKDAALEPSAADATAPSRAREAPTSAVPNRSLPPSMQVGDLPDRLARRYLVEVGALGARMYADPTSKEAAFSDAGSRLSSKRTNPNTIRDLVAIAQHRGWSSITVRGVADFRREVWTQARLAGLEVDGYKPRQRDLQALEQQRSSRGRHADAPSPGWTPGPTESVDGKRPSAGMRSRLPSPSPSEVKSARFQTLDPRARAYDPDLRAAQSHLAVLTAIARHHVPGGQARDQLLAELTDLVAQRIAAGRDFRAVHVREPAAIKERQQSAAREKMRTR